MKLVDVQALALDIECELRRRFPEGSPRFRGNFSASALGSVESIGDRHVQRGMMPAALSESDTQPPS